MFLNNRTSKDYNKNNIIIGILIIILLFILFTHYKFDTKEGFIVKNKQYVKLSDTQISKMDKKWDNLTLKQCQVKCNEDDKCVGFSRDNIDDELKGNCYPSKKIDTCHSLRKGNPEQRNKAINYNTYIKKHNIDLDNNLLNKCLGDEKLTLNRKVFINSYLKPDNYLCLENNLIIVKKSKMKDGLFFKQCGLKIIKGLEGSGTISFIMSDNNNENYYLSNNNNKYLVLLPIDVNRSNSKERSNASFELLDGLSDNNKFTIRTHSIVKKNLYLIMEGEGKKTNPRIKLVSRDYIDSNIKKESATFNIVNQIDNNSIIKSKEEFNSKNPRRYPKRLRNQYFDNFQNTKEEIYDTPIDSIILVDKEKNKLLIPAFMKEINNLKLKYLVKKYDRTIAFDDLDREYLFNEYVRLNNTSNTNKLKLKKNDTKKINDEFKKISNEKLSLEEKRKILNERLFKNIYQLSDINYQKGEYILNKGEFKVKIEDIQRINIALDDRVRIKTDNLKNVYKVIKIDYIEKKKQLFFTLDNNKIKEYNDLEKVGFNLNEINKLIITNPNINSVRIYDYDFSEPSTNVRFKNLFDKVNIVNDLTRNIKRREEYKTLEEIKLLIEDLNIPSINKTKEELYKEYIVIRAFNEQLELNSKKELFTKKIVDGIYSKIMNEDINDNEIEELRNKINRNNYFNIKSLKIFSKNPKTILNNTKVSDTNFINKKISDIEKLYEDKNNELTKSESYNLKKKNELDAYNQEILKSNMKLKNLSNSLGNKISNIYNKSLEHKVNRFAENYYMSQNNYKK